MKRNIILLIILLTFSPLSLLSQGFWFLTYEFPPQLKTAIAMLNDSTLAVGSVEGMYVSNTQGRSWEKTLSSSPVFSFAQQGDTIVATGRGRIFYSTNRGETWDSTVFQENSAFSSVKALPTGGFVAISGDISLAEGYVGSGVWFSDPDISNWQQRNNGLSGRSCGHLAVAEDGKIFITINDELANRATGVFVSENNGQTWQEVPLRVDGRNVIANTLFMVHSTALTVIEDSLYCSFRGIARNGGSNGVSVQINARKHLDEINEQIFWDVYPVFSTGAWWLDRPLYGLFRAQNGDTYAAVNGSINSGGTYFAAYGKSWEFITTGLGVDIGGGRSEQMFVQHPNGRIFMVHVGDERVYTTAQSIPVSVPLPSENVFSVFPHPASVQQPIQFSVPDEYLGSLYEFTSVTGVTVATGVISSSTTVLSTPATSGMYMLRVWNDKRSSVQKIILY